MTYYKVIDGVRYDRKLLELAEGLTKGQGDGRISLKDIQQLHAAALDGRGITTIELWTLEYILTAFNATDAAAEWLNETIDLVQPGSVPSIVNQIVREKYNRTGLTVVVAPTDVREQEALPNNQVSFEQALDQALISLLGDYSHPESPGAVVAQEYKLLPGEVDNPSVAVSFKLAELTNNGELRLLPNEPWNESAEYDFHPPQNRESIVEHWVFSLLLFDLPNAVFWIVVPRNGTDKVYNYGSSTTAE